MNRETDSQPTGVSKMTEEQLKLFDQLCDGTSDAIGPSELQSLETLLRQDANLRRQYVQYLDMHAALSWLTAPNMDPIDQAYLNKVSLELQGSADRCVQQETPEDSSSNNLFRRINHNGVAVLAASVLFCLVGFWSGLHFGTGRTEATRQRPPWPLAAVSQTQDSQVARVTGLVDCKWAGEPEELFFGKQLSSGESIFIEEGLLQLTFTSGAKVILQGPANLQAESTMEALLSYGKIAAVVPESARGYTLKTPTAEVVDLGTEFAVEVDSKGMTELHVLSGDVIARRRQTDGELLGEAVHLRKDGALRFWSESENAMPIDAQPEKFVRRITPVLTGEQLPPIPVVHDLDLWVAADLLVSQDAEGRVSAWRDVLIGDNQMSNDACQFDKSRQPVWIAESSNGKPAVRFNGKSNRLWTDSFSTGDRVTMFVAFNPSVEGQNNTRWGGPLLNFGGQAPTLELSVEHNHKVYSGLWAANAVGTEITTGYFNSAPIEPGLPCVAGYVYDVENDHAELWINRVSQGAKSAPLRAEVTSPRTIGGHGNEKNKKGFFRGDIYEVLVYDAALDEMDRQLVTDYLIDRHGAGR